MDDGGVCKRFVVSGWVQGVSFRAHTRSKAVGLGIAGYARNLPDGRVEVLACGDPQAVEHIHRWLWEGSPASRVTAVTVVDVEVENDPRGFVIG
ncbi:acylphosphatase [Thiomonas sp. FB-Cd]|uniref:acylphosphatase n=1 Tax=Thiomonas sp. FB-Cd TaxID=1158292 RepID=UPI0004DF3CAB|nr:acylphosphatase [Thiomonas sp. FB-Cd]